MSEIPVHGHRCSCVRCRPIWHTIVNAIVISIGLPLLAFGCLFGTLVLIARAVNR